MSKPDPLEDESTNFDDIEQAVMQTPRGRWFLSEYARRNRVADTELVLLQMERLRDEFVAQAQGNSMDIFRQELEDMSNSIQDTRVAIASMRPEDSANNRIMAATEELDAIVTSTERATSDILTSAERLQEISEKLRNRDLDPDICQEIEDLATQIFMACSFQDITGQRTTKVVNTMHYLEQRVHAMISIWGASVSADQVSPIPDGNPDAALLNGPALDGEGVSQDEVDRMLAGADAEAEEFSEAVAEFAGVPAADAFPTILEEPASDNEDDTNTDQDNTSKDVLSA